MADNLSTGPDAQINHTVSLLRKNKVEGALSDGKAILPGAFFVVDKTGKLSGTFKTGDGSALEVSYKVETHPKWVAAHLTLGGVDLANASLVGVVVKSQAPAATTFRPCLRSGTENGFVDCFFDKTVVAYADTSTHIDLLKLDGLKAQVPAQAPWRELILFFNPTGSQVKVQDLRVFIV